MAGDLPPGVIDLTKGPGGPPRPPPGARVPPPPPNHGQGPPPRGPPAGGQGPPQNMQRQMVQVQPQMQQVAIPPPYHMIPPEFRQRPPVEISDIRQDHLTEADARERLATYFIYRFEKLDDENEVDDEGYRMQPSWENVVRTEVRDLTKQDATRQVRLLDRTTKSVSEKKASLIPAQQRQLEKAQEDLARKEPDPRYHYVLVQIDHQLKKLGKHSVQYLVSSKDKHVKKVTIGRRHSSTSRERKHKTKFMRVSLTAFFKRMPRPEENARAMLHLRDFQREKELQMRMFPPQQMMQPEPQQQRQQQQQHQPPQQHFHPVPPPQHQKLPAANKQQPQVIQIVKNNKGGGKVYHDHHSPKSSRDSHSDFSGSYDGTDFTPESSVSSESRLWKHGRRRSRSRHRHQDRPEQYGIESAPRRHSKHEQHYILDSYPVRVPAVPIPPSPIALPSPLEIDILKEEMYHAGRADERAAARALEPRSLDDIGYRPRTALPPRVIQRRPSVRLVSPHEVVRQRFEDDLDRFERLRIEDELRFEEERRYQEDIEADIREEEFRRRRAMENRLRRQQLEEDVFAMEEQEMWEERGARPILRQRERPPHVEPNNPFAPLGRGRRNSSYVPAGYR